MPSGNKAGQTTSLILITGTALAAGCWFAAAQDPLLIAGGCTDPFINAVFADPNCTASPRWSARREALGRAESHNALVQTAIRLLGEMLGPDGGGGQDPLDRLLDPQDPCMIGVMALLLLHVFAEWQQGHFMPAFRWFSRLHDQFLLSMHPHFYDHSEWPIRDEEVRTMKDILLFHVRKFRAAAAEYGSNALRDHEDALLRENLEGFASHLQQQEAVRTRRLASETARDALEHIPAWEALPCVALTGEARRPFLEPTAGTPTLRIFVYDESLPELAPLIQGPGFCHAKQWGMDVGFHDFFRTSPIRTLDPWEADFFFVPAYAMCLQLGEVLDFDSLRDTFAALIAVLPFFNRTRGRDHIFSIHYMDLFPGWHELAPISIYLTPETEVGFELSRSELTREPEKDPPFDPFKDIAVPPYLRLSHVLELHRLSKPLAERSLLAAFAGKLWPDVQESYEVRGKLRDQFGDKPGVKVVVGESVAELLSPEAMARLMGDARFCLVPRGRAAWSVRFFETLWAGCIPVILSDYYEVPFTALFDVAQFAIKWPVDRIDDALYDYLSGLPLSVVEQYTKAAQRVRCWYLYHPPEISWVGNDAARRELDVVESALCPGLSSTRNAFQAVVELLARRKRVSKTAMETAFYWPDPHPPPGAAGASPDDSRARLRITDSDLQSIVPE